MCSDRGGESERRKVMEASCGKMDKEVRGKDVDSSMRMADSRAMLCMATWACPSEVLGDYYLKPFVIAEPKITVSKRTELDDLLVITSDGLWDALSNEVVCQVMRRHLDGHIKRRFPEGLRGSNAAEAAAVLAELAMAQGSQDNISVIAVELKKPNSKSPSKFFMASVGLINVLV
ncbi:hypothetical protein ACJRO7_006821 [Eucalyptus globulus]|uniref:PPM-type phosphatase domain-containing protein n=1 Tax=Eucalyptus globulus TaxID=34317 RepID=A0ABD3IJX3_EUCGL